MPRNMSMHEFFEGKSTCQIAIESGVSRSFVAQLKHGHSKSANVETLQRIADALNVDKDEFVIAGGKTPAGCEPNTPDEARAIRALLKGMR